MTDARVGQNITESVQGGSPPVRVGQQVTEVSLSLANPSVRHGHNITEVIGKSNVPVRVAHQVTEVLLIPSGAMETSLELNALYKFVCPGPVKRCNPVLDCLYKFIGEEESPSTTTPRETRLIGHAGIGIYLRPGRRRPNRRG